jgi:hypothetical protein
MKNNSQKSSNAVQLKRKHQKLKFLIPKDLICLINKIGIQIKCV